MIGSNTADVPPHPLITGTLAHNVLDIVHTRSSATPTVDVSQEVASCRTSKSIEHHLSFSLTEEMLAAIVSSAEAEAEAAEEEEEDEEAASAAAAAAAPNSSRSPP